METDKSMARGGPCSLGHDRRALSPAQHEGEDETVASGVKENEGEKESRGQGGEKKKRKRAMRESVVRCSGLCRLLLPARAARPSAKQQCNDRSFSFQADTRGEGEKGGKGERERERERERENGSLGTIAY